MGITDIATYHRPRRRDKVTELLDCCTKILFCMWQMLRIPCGPNDTYKYIKRLFSELSQFRIAVHFRGEIFHNCNVVSIHKESFNKWLIPPQYEAVNKMIFRTNYSQIEFNFGNIVGIFPLKNNPLPYMVYGWTKFRLHLMEKPLSLIILKCPGFGNLILYKTTFHGYIFVA